MAFRKQPNLMVDFIGPGGRREELLGPCDTFGMGELSSIMGYEGHRKQGQTEAQKMYTGINEKRR